MQTNTPTPAPFVTFTPVPSRTAFPTNTPTQTPIWWPTPTLLPTSDATQPFIGLAPTVVEEYARIAEQAVQAYNLTNQAPPDATGLTKGIGYVDWIFIIFVFVVMMIALLRLWKRLQAFGQSSSSNDE